MAAVPASLSGHVVSAEIHCRHCGYNLYGLPAGGACPECGLETWETILHTVDPASSRLPRLRDPKGVGNALVALSSALLLGALALAARPVVGWLDRVEALGPLSSWMRWLQVTHQFASATAVVIAAIIGLIAARRLGRPPAEEPAVRVQRDLRLIAAGLVGASLLVVLAAVMEEAGASGTAVTSIELLLVVPAVAGLAGLGGILDAIGRRSREYRTARGGRQGVTAMIAAVLFLAAGRALELAALDWRAQVIGTTVSSIGALMLLIGLAYLAVNTWWIRRSLRRPPPRLEEILRAP